MEYLVRPEQCPCHWFHAETWRFFRHRLQVSFGFARNPANSGLATKHRPRAPEQDDLLRPRLVAGRFYLQHADRLSDEAVVARWVENPNDQHLTGETFFQHRLPIHPSSLTRCRGRIAEEGVEWLLTQTIRAGQKSGVVEEDSAKRVAVDTTVMDNVQGDRGCSAAA